MSTLVLIIIGFSSGIAIALAVVAFIVSVGVITKLAVSTGTEKYANVYETAMLLGTVTGVLIFLFEPQFNFNPMWLTILGLFSGIFVGVVAISLVEIINVIPIMKQRTKLNRGLKYLVLSIAIGKMVGSLVYWLIPGFISK